MRSLVSLCTMVILASQVSLAAAKEIPSVQLKAESLSHLQDMRTENLKRLKEIDEALSKKIENDQMASLAHDVDDLQAKRREHVLRQDLLNRLIFQIDTKFTGGDLRTFLERSLIDMSKTDAIESSRISDDSLWQFMRYAADALHRLPEQKENVLSFLQGYMEKSVANPILPEQYLSSRNYSNGTVSEQGHPAKREDVGAIADQRLQQLKASAPIVGTSTTTISPASH